MAKALFGLLLVAGLGFTGAATYKWYTGNCPFGLCHQDGSASVETVKKGCCSGGSCCSETGTAETCASETSAKKDGECCSGNKECPGSGTCCEDKTKTEKKENKEETPK